MWGRLSPADETEGIVEKAEYVFPVTTRYQPLPAESSRYSKLLFPILRSTEGGRCAGEKRELILPRLSLLLFGKEVHIRALTRSLPLVPRFWDLNLHGLSAVVFF
jgi:hypothetical protein